MATKKGPGAKAAAKKAGGSNVKGRTPTAGRGDSKPADAAVEASSRSKASRSPESRKRVAGAPPTSTRDPRLPETGTVLRKLDRQGAVRCQCTVEADGIRYGGKVYRSLSAAAGSAASDLGIKGAQNGYIFWGISKPVRAGEDLLVRLEKSWNRYEACARSVVATAPSDRRPELIAAIERYRKMEIAAAA